MILIVGLGNPDKKYTFSRHNIGFMVIDQVVKDMVSVDKNWQQEAKFQAWIFKVGDLIFCKPLTFMNLSGNSVGSIRDFYGIETQNIWVIHDDIDLPLEKIRIRQGGSGAGHHGVDAIIKKLKSSDFIRFRLGVGRGKLAEKKHMRQNFKPRYIQKYVLSRFTDHEIGQARKMVKRAAQAVELALHKGLDRAVNEFN